MAVDCLLHLTLLYHIIDGPNRVLGYIPIDHDKQIFVYRLKISSFFSYCECDDLSVYFIWNARALYLHVTLVILPTLRFSCMFTLISLRCQYSGLTANFMAYKLLQSLAMNSQFLLRKVWIPCSNTILCNKWTRLSLLKRIIPILNDDLHDSCY